MMNEAPHQPIGQQLRQFRVAAGLSQEALAEASGVSARTISDLERGQRPGAHLETVRLLANALGLTDADRRRLQEAARPDLRFDSETPAEAPRSPMGASQWKSTLPSPSTRLVGRSSDLDTIGSLLAGQTGAVVTLTGPGGVGKTRLAVEVARKTAPSFADGVAFVDLAAISQAEQVPEAIAQVLGMAPHSASTADRLSALLETRNLLLVLDNFEHVVAAAPFVARLNASCPRLVILVTSRVRLRISAEREYAVLPLDVAQAGSPLERARASGAVLLFVERAGAVDSTFELSEQNVAAVSEICRRVDGLPLAIELAASRLRVLPVEVLLERLEHRLPLLTGGPRDLPRRQQSMRETIAWSYDLLEPAEQRFLCWMSVFVGGLSLDSTESLGLELGLDAFESLEIVTTLIESALVQGIKTPTGNPRLQMFEAIREFGLEQLARDGELDAARLFHATHFLAFAQRDAPRPDERIHDGWLATIFSERHNLVPAFDYLCQPETAELGLQFAAAMGPYWNVKGPLSEEKPRLNLAIEHAPPEPSVFKAHALYWSSLLFETIHDLDEMLSTANDCVAVAEQVGTQSDKAAAIQALAWVQEYHEHWDVARGLLEQALELWIELDNEYMQAVCLMLHGGIEYASGHLERADAVEERAGEIFRRIGIPGCVGTTTWYQGMFAVAAGTLDLAARKYDQSIRLWLESDSSSRWFKSLVGQADVAAAIGDFACSARLLGASDELLRTTGMVLTPFDEPGYARAAKASRRALGDAEFESLQLAGSRLTTDDWLADSSAIVEAASRFSISTAV